MEFTKRKRNNWVLERLDETYWHGGTPTKGMQVQLNIFEALNEDYESYEMNFLKIGMKKQIESGSRKWWEFNKILSRILILSHQLMGIQHM